MESTKERRKPAASEKHRPKQYDEQTEGPSQLDSEPMTKSIPVDDDECDEIGPHGGYGGTGPDQGGPER
jgi:hypothetical protein